MKKLILCLLLFVGCKEDEGVVTPAADTVTDIDGNVYHTVKICNQTWMVENLKTTRFNDGTAIPLVTTHKQWDLQTTPGYGWYDNDSAKYHGEYGAWYNWYAANTGKLAPKGWHIPTIEEWITLFKCLGEDVAGGKMKETGTKHWGTPNIGANDSSGFKALPGGFIDGSTNNSLGFLGYWWSSTESESFDAWGIELHAFDTYASYGRYFKNTACSIRCVKDQ